MTPEPTLLTSRDSAANYQRSRSARATAAPRSVSWLVIQVPVRIPQGRHCGNP